MRLREFLSIILTAVLFANVPGAAASAAPKDTTSRIAEKVVAMPPGSLVQVTMKTGSGSNKVLRGRLGEISQKSFHLNVAAGNQVSDREIAFDDVKSVRPAATAGSPDAQGKPSIQQQLVEINPGALIQVRLGDKSKMRGRLGKISQDGFLILSATGGEVKEQKLAFADVQSVKEIERHHRGRTAAYILVGVAAGVGILMLIAVIAYATSW
jgi:hypothetical protein